LNELDVVCDYRHVPQSGFQSVVSSNQARIHSNGQGKVQRVIDRSPRGVGQSMGVFRQRAARDCVDRDPTDVGHQAMPVFCGQLLAALKIAAGLVRDAGFDPVIVGPLARGKEFEPGTRPYNPGMSGREPQAIL
jgi:hypothetical protein